MVDKVRSDKLFIAQIDEMDRLIAVRVFVEVADRGSLTQAADQLEMSAAMVSRYLAAVEGWLGARLLHRTTRKVSLTDAGLAALVAFQRQYTQVEIVLSVGDKAADLVGERVDLAVRITNTLDPGMIARPLARCRSLLCAAPEYLQQHGVPRVAEDLRQHRCIAHAFGIGKQYRFTRGGETISVPVDWSFHTNETAVLRRAVLCGAGMLPTYYLGDELRSGRLVPLLPDHEPDVLGIHAIYLSRQHQPLALRLLVDFLAARFAGEPAPWDRALALFAQ
jgi:DNA-binding transcriptional LysR family regulator